MKGIVEMVGVGECDTNNKENKEKQRLPFRYPIE
jgi:hypothetical protein